MDIDSSSPFSRAFDEASDNIGLRFQNPLYRATELLTGSSFRSSLAIVKDFGKQIVKSAQSKRAKDAREAKVAETEVVYGSLIESLLNTFPDTSVVSDSALNFLSAGRDTTAQSLTWTFYLLMRHPAVVKRIRQEISFAFPDAPPPKHEEPWTLSFADLQANRLPYTMAVFYEALRLYPPVPFEIKQCETAVTLPDGTCLPAGSIVVWCIWSMNRSAEIWGGPHQGSSDLEKFDPSRWLDNSSKLITKTAFEFPVFNGGPRSCLGKKMAELLAAYVIVNLVREFDFEEIRDQKKQQRQHPGEERRSQNSLTLPMQGGLPCRVRLVENTRKAESS